MIKAEIVADSISTFNRRITTMVLTFPRYILAEFNTHRALSKNSASSRAIPFNKPKRPIDMMRMVQNNPFVPLAWMIDHEGMQGTEYFTAEQVNGLLLVEDWLKARTLFLETAKSFHDRKLTKQIVNRLIEPFLWHTVIVTGTEWENFFALRNHQAADIHIQELAKKMLAAYNDSTPKNLKPGEWHIPFGDRIDEDRLVRELELDYQPYEDGTTDVDHAKIQIATARCARVSYVNFEGKDDYLADVKLYRDLLIGGHMSPFEHCAKAMTRDEWLRWTISYPYSEDKFDLLKEEIGDQILIHETSKPDSKPIKIIEPGWCGNFRGFVQLRKTFNNENRKDPRVVQKKYNWNTNETVDPKSN